MFWLIVLHNYDIPHSDLLPVCVTDHDASRRATVDRWLTVIIGCAALASVNEKVVHSAHFLRSLWVQVERTRPWHCFMHDILAPGKLVCRRWQRSNIFYTLVVRIEVALTLPAVPHGINRPFPIPTSEPARILIKVVSHWWSARQ